MYSPKLLPYNKPSFNTSLFIYSTSSQGYNVESMTIQTYTWHFKNTTSFLIQTIFMLLARDCILYIKILDLCFYRLYLSVPQTLWQHPLGYLHVPLIHSLVFYLLSRYFCLICFLGRGYSNSHCVYCHDLETLFLLEIFYQLLTAMVGLILGGQHSLRHSL